MEVETRHKVLHNKLGRLIEFHLLHDFLHTVQTRALGAEYGIFSMLRGFPQRFFQFTTLTVGYVEHTFTLPDLAAAHLFHPLREDDLVASLSHQLDDFIDKVVLLAALLRLSHRLVDTTGEVNNL